MKANISRHSLKNFMCIDSLSLPQLLWGKCHCYLHPHFINKETKEQKLKELAQDHEQLRDGASIWIRRLPLMLKVNCFSGRWVGEKGRKRGIKREREKWSMCPKESEIVDNIVLERKKFEETSQPGSYQFCNFWHQSLWSLALFPAFGFHQIPLFIINFLFCLSKLVRVLFLATKWSLTQ